MKVIFFGSDEFGLPSLERIHQSGHKIACVVTMPEKPGGRGLTITPSPVKVFAQKNRLMNIQFESVFAGSAQDELRKLGADVFAVVSFGMIFTKEFLNLAPHGCVNLHASLLPKYRGASPIVRAILNGDGAAGVTTIKLVEKLDAGDILLQDRLNLCGEENADDVYRALAALGAETLVRTLDGLEKGEISPRKQDEKEATWAPKVKKEEAWVDWSRDASHIHNHVRAFYQWPGSKTMFKGKEIILKGGAPVLVSGSVPGAIPEGQAWPGTILNTGDPLGIWVQTGTGVYAVGSLTVAGKRRMSHRDFVNGYPVKPGDRFEPI